MSVDELEDEDIIVASTVKQLLNEYECLEDDFVGPLKYIYLISQLDDDVIVRVIESVPTDIRIELWRYLPSESYWDILQGLQTETARHITHRLDDESLTALRQSATAELALQLADVIPDTLLRRIIDDQEDEIADEINEALSFEDNQLGRYLNKNIMRIRSHMTVERLIQKLHSYRAEEQEIVAIFVFDKDRELLGYIPLEELIYANPQHKIETLTKEITEFAHRDEIIDVVRRVQGSDGALWYPIRGDKHIVRAVSLSNIMWEVGDQLSDVHISESGNQEEDLFTPLSISARIRGLWLVINLMTAFLASWAIGWFEVALQEIVALAILMPVVASMGGIAGSQTLAVAIRGLALNHLSDANINLLFKKEVMIGLLNGTLIGALIGLVVNYWFDSWGLGLIIFIAIVINNLAAASSGTFIPFILKKMHIDPAVSGSVILTTVTDIVGFVIFLGLASIFLISH